MDWLLSTETLHKLVGDPTHRKTSPLCHSMKTPTIMKSPSRRKAQSSKLSDESQGLASMPKRQKQSMTKKIKDDSKTIHPWTNLQTEDFLATFVSEEKVSPLKKDQDTIPTLAIRYSKKYQDSISKTDGNEVKSIVTTAKAVPDCTKEKRMCGRIAIGTNLCDECTQDKIDDTSLGFSWWSNSKREDCLTQTEYNRSCTLMNKGFNGEIFLTPLAGPNIAYAFVVPCYTQIGMMTTFKTMPNQLLIRERMKELSSMKTCYYTQLHWKRGTGNASHLNESDWRDNPLLDPTSSLLLDAYMSSLSAAISSATQWNMEYKTLCSVIETGIAGHQAPHVDDKGCLEKEEQFRPFILHHPLCEEGSSLQIWLPNDKGSHSPTLVHVPFGTALLLRGDVYHAGSYGTKGNIRFHAHLTPHQCTAEGRELGIMNIDCNERFRETDLAAEHVNDILLQKNKQQRKFTSKYLKRMKQIFPVKTFWFQNPERNVLGKPKRTEYS